MKSYIKYISDQVNKRVNVSLDRFSNNFHKFLVVSSLGIVISEFVNEFINFGSFGVKRDLDVSDNWDLHVFSTVNNGVSLCFAVSFRETSEFFGVFLVCLCDGGFSAFSVFDFEKGDTGGRVRSF